MITTEQIIERICKGLKNLSKEKQIGHNEIKIKVVRIPGLFASVKCYLMSGENIKEELDFKSAFSLNVLEATPVKSWMTGKLTNLMNKYNIKEVNARICSKDENFSPYVVLFDKDTEIKKMTIDELKNS